MQDGTVGLGGTVRVISVADAEAAFAEHAERIQLEWTIGSDYKGWDSVKERYCGLEAKVRPRQH